jgi:hypothetical protein
MPTARENCSPRAVGNAQKQGALIMTNRVQESKSKATLTVAELAEEKCLPLDFPRDLDVADHPEHGILIPYFDHDGEELFTRERDTPTCEDKKRRFHHPYNVKLRPYGRWKLDDARCAGHVYLCEGESDTWTLWNVGLPALGLPGSDTTGKLEAGDLSGIGKVYVVPDNDEGGATFVRGIEARLGKIDYRGKAWALTIPDDFKDVSELWVSDPDRGRFCVRLADLVGQARSLDCAAAPHPSRNGSAPTPAPTPARGDPPSALAICFADMEELPIEWFWTNWIPRGALTVLDGDPGLGKSTITIDLAARASRGWNMPPDASGEMDGVHLAASGVLLTSAEDDPARTTKKRLRAAGADLAFVHSLDVIRCGSEERPLVLPDDLGRVEDQIVRVGAVLWVLDPLMAFLSSSVDAHRDQDIRRLLYQFKLLAERTRCAVLVVRHLNKLSGGSALKRGGGSIGITGAARSALVVGRDPSNPRVRVLAAAKSNLGPEPRSLIYSLEPEGDVARIGWGTECDLSADDILAQPGQHSREGRAEDCAAALREALESGPQAVGDVEALLKSMGYGDKTKRAAKKIVGVKSDRVGGIGDAGVWMMRLPKVTEREDGEDDIPE